MKKISTTRIVAGLTLTMVISAFLFGFSGQQTQKSQSAINITVPAVDNIVIDEMAKRGYIGCAVAVISNGKIIHQSGYGHMDELRKTPVTVNTVFNWASISKTMTSLAAWKLINAKKFSQNDKVKDLVNYWPGGGDKGLITVSNLMTHRSGINHYTNYNKGLYISSLQFNAQQSVNVFSAAPLDFTPGSKNQYSTFGYNLLGAVVDVKSGSNYFTYVKSNISIPLGMSSFTETAAGHKGYELSCNGGMQQQEEGSVMWKLPGGGWSSNIIDLAKFAIGLMDDKIISNTSVMWNTVANNGNWCYGLKNQTAGSDTRVSHGGANDEVSTEMSFYPSSRFGLVVYINGDAYADGENLARRIEKFYGKTSNPDEDGQKTINCGVGQKCNTSDGEDQLAGLWRPDAGETVWRRRLGEDQFYAEWDWLNKNGYDLIDIETYLVNEVRYWDGIFKKQSRSSAMWRNFSYDGFLVKWKELISKGYVLIDLETYLNGKDRVWAGVFETGGSGAAIYRNLDPNEFVEKHHDLQNQNKSLIDVEVIKDDNGNFLWSGVWIAGPATHFWGSMSITEMNAKIKEEAVAGYKLKDIETYLDGSSRKWAGVFDKFSKTCAFSSDRTYCELATDDASFIKQTSPQHLMDIEIFK